MVKLIGALCCIVAFALGWFAVAGSAAAQHASVGTPVPGGSFSGGGGVLKPHFSQHPPPPPQTNANVDKYGAAGPVTDPADPNYEPDPDYAAEISFNSSDHAYAEKTFSITAKTSNVALSVPVRWHAEVEYDLEAHGRTVNVPAQKDDTTYKTHAVANGWAKLHADPLPQGGNEGHSSGKADVLIENDDSGELTDPVTWSYEHRSAGAVANPGDDHKIKFTYGVRAEVWLEAHRPEVGVGGYAKAKVVSATLGAWDHTDPDDPESLSKADGTPATWSFD